MSVNAGVTDSPEARWRAEIGRWLLGRLSDQRIDAALAAPTEALLHAPFLGWWLFEGLPISSEGDTISRGWSALAERAEALLRTWNPRVKIVDRPEGRVDWERTLAMGPQPVMREFVTTTSGVGLRDDERAALLGWSRWLLALWEQWRVSANLSPAELATARPFELWVERRAPARAEAPADHLRRWAFVARRSRWPMLRDVVAPTLWAYLNPRQQIDRVPLPAQSDKLFQLYAAVCISRAFNPAPRCIRWLPRGKDATTGTSAGVFDDGLLHIAYERDLSREAVVRSRLFPHEATKALRRQQVGVPSRLDVLVTFRDRSSPFEALIVEVKSGQQTPGDALFQLMAYRYALREEHPGRTVVWGVGDGPAWQLQPEALAGLAQDAANAHEDVWVFSTPEEAATVLSHLRLIPPQPDNEQSTPERVPIAVVAQAT